jgi:dipeptidyl aminopeptidase/acylaminoacyl peptidase
MNVPAASFFAVLLLEIVIILSIVALVIAAIAFIISWRMTRPGKHTYWDEYTFLPSDMGVSFENVHFSAADGLRLAGWLMAHPDAAPVIVMASGYRDRKTSLLPIAAGLWRQGFNIFLFDFRNQGDSQMDSYQTMGWRERQDMTAALDEVSARLPGTKIGALGWSMGAAVCLLTAATDQRIKAVVSDSAFAVQTHAVAYNVRQVLPLPVSLFVALAELFTLARAGYRPSQVRPEDAISQIAPRPVLLIHGEQDDMCPVSDAHRLFARAGDPKQLWLMPKARHVGAYFADPDAYIARVGVFFHHYLS